MGHRPAAAGKRWPQPERGVWLMRLGPWRIGQSSWKDGSFITLLFPSVMAANGGNSVTPAWQPTAKAMPLLLTKIQTCNVLFYHPTHPRSLLANY